MLDRGCCRTCRRPSATHYAQALPRLYTTGLFVVRDRSTDGTPTLEKEISICCLIPRRPKEASSLGTRRAGCQEELSVHFGLRIPAKVTLRALLTPLLGHSRSWVLGNSAPGRIEGCHHFSPAGTRISTSNRRRAKTAPHCDAGMSSSWFSSCSRVARPARRLRCSLPGRPERTLRRRASLAT